MALHTFHIIKVNEKHRKKVSDCYGYMSDSIDLGV